MNRHLNLSGVWYVVPPRRKPFAMFLADNTWIWRTISPHAKPILMAKRPMQREPAARATLLPWCPLERSFIACRHDPRWLKSSSHVTCACSKPCDIGQTPHRRRNTAMFSRGVIRGSKGAPAVQDHTYGDLRLWLFAEPRRILR